MRFIFTRKTTSNKELYRKESYIQSQTNLVKIASQYDIPLTVQSQIQFIIIHSTFFLFFLVWPLRQLIVLFLENSIYDKTSTNFFVFLTILLKYHIKRYFDNNCSVLMQDPISTFYIHITQCSMIQKLYDSVKSIVPFKV